ncbi:hypothetical protein JDV02_009248 [Purpureocillium takamizusanense]|uniref:Uncharacterized protein n=1 Tax=Purpureocillium takamizusanense TaxID=2060973 RepID=A0A9Q8QPJ4_9HYPO|nr:uncharacterized protein JDV02_009248 [Purpureocillium takamizusanense]UNI23430.1 hypothetical protein JDV02_009248 [Purpureocillium takamizusanense]
MAPVRRYLRITKYSVLECRIYLDNPALAQSWLLNPRDPVLPRVIESIRPLVLPKLREEKERERSKKKSSKKKNVKDVIVQDDFEVSMFLTETSTRHSLLTKQKHFREAAPPMIQSNSTRLMGETSDAPVDVDAESTPPPVVLREESDEGDGLRLANIPHAGQRQKRRRMRANPGGQDGDDASDTDPSDDDGPASAIEIDSDAEEPAAKRLRGAAESEAGADDDKKKLAMDVSYEGFAIYGRVLCLVVKRRDTRSQLSLAKADGRGPVKATAGEGQAKMENWITSTQIPVGEEEMP